MKDVTAAVKYIREKVSKAPDIALILGSGLGALAETVQDAVFIDTEDIPGYPVSTVIGHKGRLVFGKLGDAHVVVVQGRIHMYEGYGPESVIFPVRLVNFLGAHSLIVTNAAGGISRFLHPGSLMWITDHIDWTFSEREARPSGGSENGRSRLRSVPDYYDLNWMKQAEERALEEGIQTFSGTYLWTRGPSYETKAEIRAFQILGADAVGMSTVPEVVEATRLNMTVAGISTITNYAAGISDQKLDHSEVIEVGLRVKKDLERLVMLLIESTPV
ncbi:MAG: purine-nucleoside phosphorylase [Bacteroidetes bacterium]|nr:MAG: purine-nucleoside phosphorylase [Bacteroidota bacterium]